MQKSKLSSYDFNVCTISKTLELQESLDDKDPTHSKTVGECYHCSPSVAAG